ncbi:hypothetical protein GCM10029964_096630 [Kibdelosporangium lantanae]
MPVRTSLGAMAITFFMVTLVTAANDIIAQRFDVSLNAVIWAGRIGLLLLPPLAYYITYHVCLGLQRSDRAVLDHGIETGIVKRLPYGQFIEVHQPLGPADEHGHPLPLPYQGAPVPKKMNKLGAAGAPAPSCDPTHRRKPRPSNRRADGNTTTTDPVSRTSVRNARRCSSPASPLG